MEYQEFIKLMDDMKNAGCYYNDADFCRKMGIGSSRLSMMRTAKRPITERFVHKMREVFPDFFRPKTVAMGDDSPTLGDVARMVAEHDRRFHDQMERIMDAMGVPEHREKSA